MSRPTALSRLAAAALVVALVALAPGAAFAAAGVERHLPALGTDVAASDQQSPIATPVPVALRVPAQAPAAGSEGVAVLPFALSLVAAAALGAAGAFAFGLVRTRRRGALTS